MIRALVTLAGAAVAAFVLYLAPRAESWFGHGIWATAAAWAVAGLALGLAYQLGGIRRPGLRLNLPLLLLAWLPWTALTVGLTAQARDPGSNIAGRLRDILPDGWILRWASALPAFAFGSGLLLAFALVEPRIHRRVEEDRVDEGDVRRTPVAPVIPATPAPAPVAERPTATVPDSDVRRDVARTDDTLVGGSVVEAPTRVVEPDRSVEPGRPGALRGDDETVVIRPSQDDTFVDRRLDR